MGEGLMKRVVIFILGYVIGLMLLVLGLYLTCMIPREKILNNLMVSSQQLQEEEEYFYYHVDGNASTMQDNFADSVSLQLAYFVDATDPFGSMVSFPYYHNPLQSLYNLSTIFSGYEAPNLLYTRYFHGNQIIIRPMLMKYSYHGIKDILKIIFWGLFIIYMGILLWRKAYGLFFSIGIGFFMTYSMYVPTTLEYIWVYLLAFIFSIMAVFWYKKSNTFFYFFFMIAGLMTNFFDFLTTETIVLLLPLLTILCFREKESPVSLKKGISFCVCSLLIFFLSYGITWVIKWLLAHFYLGLSFSEIFEGHLAGRGISLSVLRENILFPFYAIVRNLLRIWPFVYISDMKLMYYFFLLFIVVLGILFLKRKFSTYQFLLLFVLLLPFGRLFFMANHSYYHHFFTFRALFPSISAFVLLVLSIRRERV